MEVRYAANRTKQIWYQQNLNSVNIVENGWIGEFRNAQANLYANKAAGKGNTFRYDSTVAGTKPLPIILAYLGAEQPDPTVSANYTSSVIGSTQANVFTTTSYINSLNTYSPSPTTIASALYGNLTWRTNALAAGLPRNFFMMNPDVQSGGAWIYKNGGGSQYDSMVIELRRRMAKGLLVQASYVRAKAFSINWLSWRAPWVKDLGGTLPHALKINWVYELPFGQGRTLFGTSGRLVDRFVGGWELEGSARMQSGNLLDLGNVNLVGMTDRDLIDSAGIYYDDAGKKIWYLPMDLKNQTYYAYQYDASGFTSGARSATGRPRGAQTGESASRSFRVTVHPGTTTSGGRSSPALT